MTPSTLPTGGSALTGDQLHTLRGMLLQQRSFRVDQLAELAVAPPAGLDAGIAASLAQGARHALRDVLIALQRMDQGTYGRCRDCGTAIAPARLEILPQTTLCLPCQQAA